jgi:hypothetical protein
VYVSLDNGSTWVTATTTVDANTWNLASQTLTGSSTLQVKVTDLAGNDGAVYSHAYVLDSTAPTVSITPSTTSLASNGTETVTFAFSEAVSGFELGDITASNGTFSALTQVGSSNSYTATFTASTIGSSVFGVSADSYTDVAGNLGAAGSSASVAVTPEIALGNLGNLIAPVEVNNQWYYHWDLNGDGVAGGATAGSVNGTQATSTIDTPTMTYLSTLFNHSITDAAGASGYVVNGNGTIDATHHYAWINGVHLSLSTANGVDTTPSSNTYLPGTAVSNNTTTANPTYDGLLGIWDSSNGTSTATSLGGAPSGWRNGGYWSATSPISGQHLIVYLDTGFVYTHGDTDSGYYVALQVLPVL